MSLLALIICKDAEKFVRFRPHIALHDVAHDWLLSRLSLGELFVQVREGLGWRVVDVSIVAAL